MAKTHPFTIEEQQLANCLNPECCIDIKEPGNPELNPFLSAAEKALRENFDGDTDDYFNLKGPRLYPPFIKTIGDQEQKGLSAEYQVFYKLAKSTLPVHIFFSWKPRRPNYELDFVILAKNAVIVLEVKAFQFFSTENSSEAEKAKGDQWFEDIKQKGCNQLDNGRKLITDFLETHGCKQAKIRIETCVIFVNMKVSDCIVKPSHPCTHILFGDDYLIELDNIITKVDQDIEAVAMRTLLSWFYGTYAYVNIGKGERMEGNIDPSVTPELNEVHKDTKTAIAGVFLSRAQLEVVKSGEKFLAIIGPPGTGKTYCLVAKIKEVYQEMKKSEEEGEEVEDLIVVMHPIASTLKYIQGLVRTVIEEPTDKYLKFLDPSDEKGLGELLELKNTTYKIFFDDNVYSIPLMTSTREAIMCHRKLVSNANLVWYTSYAVPSARRYPYRPISHAYFTNTAMIEEKNKFAVLTLVLRNSCEIATLAQAIYLLDGPEYGPFKIIAHNDKNVPYEIGHRIIGHEIDYVKSSKETFSDTVLAQISKLSSLFSLKNIWVGDLDYKLPLKISLAVRFPECRYAFYEEYRGQERECVVVLYSESHRRIRWDEFFEMITRATSKLVVIYNGRPNSDLDRLFEQSKASSPVIASTNKKEKIVSAFRSVPPYPITDVLNGKGGGHLFCDIHFGFKSCPSSENDRNAKTLKCDLSCARTKLVAAKVEQETCEKLIKELEIVKM